MGNLRRLRVIVLCLARMEMSSFLKRPDKRVPSKRVWWNLSDLVIRSLHKKAAIIVELKI